MNEQDLPSSAVSSGELTDKEILTEVGTMETSGELESPESTVNHQEVLDHLSQASLNDLTAWLKNAVQDTPDSFFRQSFAIVRSRFRELIDAEKSSALAEFIAQGGIEEDFQFSPNEEMSAIREQIRKLKESLAEYRRRVEKEQEANFLAKKDLLDELKSLISEESDMRRAFERFNQLKSKWAETGNVPRGKADELYNNWRHFQQTFYQLASIHRELFQKELEKNLEIKTALLERVKNLHAEAGIKKSVETLHRIQQEWRETGPVPREQDKTLFQEFKDACQVIYGRKDEHLKLLKAEQEKNLEKKQILCAEMEALAQKPCQNFSEWKPQETEALEIEARWRKTGRVGKEMNEEIWQRFREAKKIFFKKRISLAKERDADFQNNYAKKVALCEKAEAIKDATDWKETSQKLVKLQQEWKKIGPVERKRSDEIWKRFRAACDHFFQAKDAWFNGREDRDKSTIEARKSLIDQLKAMPKPENPEEGIEALKPLQEEWNKPLQLAPAARKALEEEWNAAVEQYYGGLGLDPLKRERMSYKAKLDTMLAGANPLAALRDERSFVGNRIRKLEEEAVQIENNLAFFGNSKGADSLRKQYADKVETLREQIARLEDKRFMLKHTIAALEKKDK
jgi:hypothetical protein